MHFYLFCAHNVSTACDRAYHFRGEIPRVSLPAFAKHKHSYLPRPGSIFCRLTCDFFQTVKEELQTICFEYLKKILRTRMYAKSL